MGKIDYIILLLLFILPPTALQVQSYKEKEREIIIPLESIEVGQKERKAIVFGEIRNNRQSNLLFKKAQYIKSATEINKIFQMSLTEKVTVLAPGESLNTGMIISTASFKPENLELVFNETEAEEDKQVECNIEYFNIKTQEAECNLSHVETCYRPVLNAQMTNTGDLAIYSVRFYDADGPAGIIDFQVKTGEILGKWLPGKTLDIRIEKDRDLDYKPVHYNYDLNYL